MNTWRPETITIKYLVKGHTFMAVDAIHGNIGKLFRKTSTAATFDGFVQICEKASNNIKAIALDLPFIYPISKARTRSSIKVKMPLMESIVEVQFKKENSMLHYKESFLEESYFTVNFLQPCFLKKGGLKTFPAPSTERCGITQSKRDNIVSTLKGVPQSAHSFWNSIYCNNTSPDLCCFRDVLEEEEC